MGGERIEYGLRFICADTQEGHEGHAGFADYDDVIPRDDYPDAVANRGTVNGHAVKVVQRTVTYGPWVDATDVSKEARG